ncbi:MAG: hypothetical protein IJD69_04680 [Alphaproteobacteria bacterium]|nr:hypothetical protein [Alphaproteobacteria bacterium]
MAIPAIIVRAIPTVLRAVAKPAVFKRFLGTKAGKKAVLKYGTMLVKSKDVRNAIGNFINRNGDKMKNDKAYKQQLKDYAAMEKRVEKLEQQLAAAHDNNEKIQILTFTLGRNVVEMQQLLVQMQAQYQQTLQQQMAMAANAHTR